MPTHTIFLDINNNVVDDINKAASFIINEYDKSNILIHEYVGTIK